MVSLYKYGEFMLDEREWNIINNILLEIYTIDNITSLMQKLFLVLRMLIPYTKGYMVLLDDNRNIMREKSYFEGMEERGIDDYINKYYDSDYLKFAYEINHETMVYRDSDILNDNLRVKTDFFREFLKNEDIPYGCGILIINNNRILGVFNLFRNETLGDFKEKDIYILNVLKGHIANIIYNLCSKKAEVKDFDRFDYVKNKYELTKRECEILKLISKGLLNNEIGDTLSISLSTVKKHIYNLFNKMGVNSRTQLVNLVYSYENNIN